MEAELKPIGIRPELIPVGIRNVGKRKLVHAIEEIRTIKEVDLRRKAILIMALPQH